MRSSSVWARRSRRLRLLVPLALAIAWGAAIGADVIDRVLATVEGRVITLSDVRIVKTLGLVAVPAGADADTTILKALIDRLLVLEEVERYAPPEPEDAAIEQRVERYRPASRHPRNTRRRWSASVRMPSSSRSGFATICGLRVISINGLPALPSRTTKSSRTTGASTLTNSRGAVSRWTKWSC